MAETPVWRSSEEIAHERIMVAIQQSAWFGNGLRVLQKLEELWLGPAAWFIPKGLLPLPDGWLLEGATLYGLPVYETEPGTPPYLGVDIR